MGLFTTRIEEGLRFDTEEEAIEFFKSSLKKVSAQSKIVQAIHAHKFEGYTLQATGDNEKEFHVQLMQVKNPEEFLKVAVDTSGSQEDISEELVIELLEQLVRTTEVTKLVIEEQLFKIATEAKKNADKYVTDVFPEIDALKIKVETISNLKEGIVNIYLSDGETKQYISGAVPTDEYMRINMEDVEKTVESMFLSKLAGKFNKELFSVDGHKIGFLLDYAEFTGRTLSIELLNDSETE